MNSEKKPLYILAVAPYESSKLKLFESGSNSISELLMNERGTRYSGWDLSTGDRPKIIKGEYLESKIDGTKKVNLYEDGRFICWVAADPNFLAWPSKDEEFKEKPRINPLALIEFTFNFVNFYKKLIPFFITAPNKVKFVIQLKNAYINQNTKLYIIPGGLNSFEWLNNRGEYFAPENDMDANEDISIIDLATETPHVAYLLVEKIYFWFGIDKALIPYVSEENGKRMVDIEKIKNNKDL